jgi:pimeloyl-ACP methyl ester carboxylesterase
MRTRACAVALALLAAGSSSPAAASGPVGTTLPNDFPVIMDRALGKPVIGFGAKGPVRRTPVVFLHGNNDTPFPTTCSALGHIHDFAQYFHERGYALSELWGLGYQGEQCDLLTSPPNRSSEAHSTVANAPEVGEFIRAVLRYTGARQVDVVGHSLGTTVTREWMRAERAWDLVRTLVAVDGPNHGIINCSPSPRNYYALPAAGGFNPDSAVCREYGSDRTPLLASLNAGDETPGPTAYLALVNADTSFVYFDKQDGAFAPVPAEDREGRPHDFSRSARLDGAVNVELTGQGRYDESVGAAHLGIVNSPESWRIAFHALDDRGRPAAAAPVSSRDSREIEPAARVRVPPRVVARVRRRGARFVTSGRVVPPSGVACGSGRVTVQVRAAGATLSTRHTRLRPACRFTSTVRLRGRRLAFSVQFAGNEALTPATVSVRPR